MWPKPEALVLAVQVVYEPSSGPHGVPARKFTHDRRILCGLCGLHLRATSHLGFTRPHETKGPRPAAIAAGCHWHCRLKQSQQRSCRLDAKKG